MNDEPLWKGHPLLATMWKTKNSRFHAADRLRSRAWWKGIALSLLSAYVLVLSVIPKFLSGISGGVHGDYVGLVTLAASIIILVLSVISVFDDDKIRSKYMHDNAREVASLYHRYKLDVSSSIQNTTDSINEKYQSALDKCPYNHDPIDYEKTCIDIEVDDGNSVQLRKFRHSCWLFYDIYFWPILALVSPLALTLWLFGSLTH